MKHPVDWFDWGADFRFRWEYLENPYLRTSDPPGHVWDFHRYRARVWDTITPNPNLEFNMRVNWEGRQWFEPDSKGDWDPAEIIVETLNAKIKGGKDTPMSLTVGRQDIMLGNGWLVLEGTPLDGSRSIYFDAARFSIDLKSANTSADVIYIQQEAEPDVWLPPADISGRGDRPQIEQDERGVILYLKNKSVQDTSIEPYFIYKHDERVLANGDEGDIYTLGARVERNFSPHLQGRVEGAYQFGNRDNPALFPNSNGDLSAFGANSRLTYQFKDSMKDQVWFGYEYLSGDDPGTGRNEQFDPLWARWPQWSELYVYTYASETRIAETSNLHRLNVGWQIEPAKNLSLAANYDALFADQNPHAGEPGFSRSGSFRGNLLTGTVKYQFNKYTAGHLWAEYFLPGDYYRDAPGALSTREDPAAYFRVEVTFTY